MFCFPHAGGGIATYRLWPAGLPDDLEIWAAQLPGRASRWREPPLKSIPALVDALTQALLPHIDRPFLFFGHSMGAVLAFEVTRALVSTGRRVPQHLVVSGYRPPGMPGIEAPMHRLPNDAFIAEIDRRYGGIPVELLCEREVLALLLPGLRADIMALETFEPEPRAPLDCPISAFGGVHDRLAPRTHLEAWCSQTSGVFRTRAFPGDHFYLNSQRVELLAELSTIALPMLRRPVPLGTIT
jgi:surfactin synthase thioesterase subunit